MTRKKTGNVGSRRIHPFSAILRNQRARARHPIRNTGSGSPVAYLAVADRQVERLGAHSRQKRTSDSSSAVGV
jgi:hypothetical protein